MIEIIRNPEKLNKVSDLDDLISALSEFETINNAPAVVIERQNLTLGRSFDIVARDYANARLGKWVNSEVYLRSWDKVALYGLRQKYGN